MSGLPRRIQIKGQAGAAKAETRSGHLGTLRASSQKSNETNTKMHQFLLSFSVAHAPRKKEASHE